MANTTIKKVIIDGVEHIIQLPESQVTGLVTDLDNIRESISTEKQRAEAAEETLTNDLNTEIERSTDTDADLQNQIDALYLDGLTIHDCQGKSYIINKTTSDATFKTDLYKAITNKKSFGIKNFKLCTEAKTYSYINNYIYVVDLISDSTTIQTPSAIPSAIIKLDLDGKLYGVGFGVDKNSEDGVIVGLEELNTAKMNNDNPTGTGTFILNQNKFKVDTGGNVEAAGKITVGTTPTNNMDVTTKQYVDTGISTAISALDVEATNIAQSETIKTISETDGKINVSKQSIQIAESQVTNLPTDLSDINTRIDNITALGRFLSVWDATTGLPETEPPTKPYDYKSGDYFIVGKVGTTNYRPSGTQYTGAASTTQETETVKANDYYKYDGNNVWTLISVSVRTYTWSEIANKPTTRDGYALSDVYTKTETNTNITNAINNLDVVEVGEDGKYIKKIKEENGKISTTLESFETSIGTPSTTASNIKAPTSKAVQDYVSTYGGKIDSISINGTNQPIDENKNIDLPGITTETQAALDLKMDKANPTGSGAFSLNRKEGSAVGTKSFAEGNNTTASGESSHAEGQYTTALGIGAHSEGYSAAAEDSSSVAITPIKVEDNYLIMSNASHEITENSILKHTDASGNSYYYGVIGVDDTEYSITLSEYIDDPTTSNWWKWDGIAYGDYSHSEGNSTKATASASHAEGYKTVASGNYGSHAEGGLTLASGSYSHAEGDETVASGARAHAEGEETVASGRASHSEGNMTIASGEASHAEGLGTKASSDYQHVFGKYNINDTDSTYVEIVGNGDEETTLNARTLDWAGNEWISGKLHAKGITLDGSNTFTRAYGENSISIGTGTSYSYTAKSIKVAENKIYFSGVLNHYYGVLFQGKSIFGISSWGSSGNDTYVVVTPINGSVLVNNVSLPITIHTGVAGGKNSIAIGDNAAATQERSVAIGYNAVASAENAIAIGSYATADGYGAFATGIANSGMGPYAHGSGSHAEGEQTKAIGIASHAEGRKSKARGDYSHAEGYDTETSETAEYSHAEGLGTITSANYQHVEGKFNTTDTTSAFIIGNGESSTSRSNALTVDWSGNETLAGTVIIGKNQLATGAVIADKELITKEYLVANGGKIDEIQINGTTQTITNKIVNLPGITTETQAALNLKADKVSDATNGNLASLDSTGNLVDSGTTPLYFGDDIAESSTTEYQPLLVSGTNIKTINNQTILGSGNLEIKGIEADTEYSATSLNAQSGVAVAQAISTKENLSNKESTVTATSTEKYPSSKAVADFINSSIATNTANFLGTLDATIDLGLTKPASHADIVSKLNTYSFSSKTNNDYCFVVNKDSDEDVIYERFKYISSSQTFAYEYSLNNSSFTQVQWNAINSGIDDTKVSTYDGYAATIAEKQDIINDTNKLSVSLVDGLSTVATSGDYGDLSNKPSLATVATSGKYTDLSDTPTSVDGLAGGTISSAVSVNGNINGKYLIGTCLQTTASTDNANYTDFFVNGDGWLYKRSKASVKSDLGVNTLEGYFTNGKANSAASADSASDATKLDGQNASYYVTTAASGDNALDTLRPKKYHHNISTMLGDGSGNVGFIINFQFINDTPAAYTNSTLKTYIDTDEGRNFINKPGFIYMQVPYHVYILYYMNYNNSTLTYCYEDDNGRFSIDKTATITELITTQDIVTMI